ncbi:DUF1338 domain-containing protein [Jeongeupia chitinilytica]|uniref:2-oxoadipate dioxygenase/decarboxylase n=1 Tax=Jeongeupia chitinilytica TaxID=1041641 RepID=A0ABQ3GZQ8_9NEIS|nr:DUF1338 domain-containing protein [Jeongeupia chitinilytica]GHD63251.1 DUF1338 domain-containing protein [Jeongeupia chitinilytica]
MSNAAFFDALWADHVAIAPQSAAIHALFAADNPVVINDHVAFRTFDTGPLSLARLETRLFDLGYRRHAPYSFPDKHLSAWGYVPADPDDPLVFLSELHVGALSSAAQALVTPIIDAIDPALASTPDVFLAGRVWPAISYGDYRMLAQESEYAGWLAALGLHANHFTVAVHRLHTPTTLEAVVQQVRTAGFAVNNAGGAIKGTPAELLEQAATLADRQPVSFAGGETHVVPTCYYEFARRYPDIDGRLYQGFVAASANRIFESTDRGHRT